MLREGVTTVDAVAEFADTMLSRLTQTHTDQACEQLSRIAQVTNEPSHRALAANAIAALHAATWSPLQPGELAEALADPRRRAVTSEAQLATTIVEVLDELQRDITSDAVVRRRYWDRQAGGDDRWRPLGENDVSTAPRPGFPRRCNNAYHAHATPRTARHERHGPTLPVRSAATGTASRAARGCPLPVRRTSTARGSEDRDVPVIFDDDDNVVFDQAMVRCSVQLPDGSDWYVMRRGESYRLERFEDDPWSCYLHGDGPQESHAAADLADALQRLQHEAGGDHLEISLRHCDVDELLEALTWTPAERVLIDEVAFDRHELPDQGPCFLPGPGDIDRFATQLAHRNVWWEGPGPVSWDRSETLYWLGGVCVLETYDDSDGSRLYPIGRFPDHRSALLAARSSCELIAIDDQGNVIDTDDDQHLGQVSLGRVLDRADELVRASPDEDEDEDEFD